MTTYDAHIHYMQGYEVYPTTSISVVTWNVRMNFLPFDPSSLYINFDVHEQVNIILELASGGQLLRSITQHWHPLWE